MQSLWYLTLEELRILDTGLGWKCTDEREPVVTFAGREIKAAQWQRYVLFLPPHILQYEAVADSIILVYWMIGWMMVDVI